MLLKIKRQKGVNQIVFPCIFLNSYNDPKNNWNHFWEWRKIKNFKKSNQTILNKSHLNHFTRFVEEKTPKQNQHKKGPSASMWMLNHKNCWHCCLSSQMVDIVYTRDLFSGYTLTHRPSACANNTASEYVFFFFFGWGRKQTRLVIRQKNRKFWKKPKNKTRDVPIKTGGADVTRGWSSNKTE